MSFFDFFTCAGEETPPVDEIALKPIAFRLWVMNYALADGVWPVIGNVKIRASIAHAPWFFKQDPLSKKVTLTRGREEEVAASLGQVDGIERAAVWDPEHVVDRLRDHLDGRPNMWFESLKARNH